MATVLALAVGISVLTAGCGTGSRYDPAEELEDNGPPEQVAVEPEAPLVDPAPAPAPPTSWSCHYDPTYDEDWHNDVLCSNGTDLDRPYLRQGDDFITQDEIMESAGEYEDYLNAG
jgi:hypothetical protein